jgi:hypothetical protein
MYIKFITCSSASINAIVYAILKFEHLLGTYVTYLENDLRIKSHSFRVARQGVRMQYTRDA